MARKCLAAYTDPTMPAVGYVSFVNITKEDDETFSFTVRNNDGVSVTTHLKDWQFRELLGDLFKSHLAGDF